MHRTVMVQHPEFGFWFVPNQYAYVDHPDRGHYVVQTNSMGLRSDRDHSLMRRPGSYRVLLFGDSFTAADGVHNSERFSDVLESLDERLEVINFGLPASGVDQQLLIFERMAHRFEADMVLLCPMVSDIERNLMHYRAVQDRTKAEIVLVPKPYFTMDDRELLLHNSPTPREKLRFDDAPDEIKKLAVLTKGTNFRRSSLGKLAVRLERVAGGAFAPLVGSAWRLRRSALRSPPHPHYQSPTHPAWRLMRAILERFIAQAGARELVLAPLPNYQYLEALIGRKPGYLTRFQEICDQSPGTGLVDVLQWMRRYPLRTRRRFRFNNDAHFTPEAHVVVAEALYEDCLRERVNASTIVARR